MGQLLRNLTRRWANPRLVADMDRLRYKLIGAEAAVGRLTQERDHARQEASDVKDCNEWQVDQIESLEKALDAAREETRQAQTARVVAEQDAAMSRAELADAEATVEGLGMRNTELEQLLEKRQFLDEDQRHALHMETELD